jgi:uncharacterized repeat protein (TIGR03803 family)
MPAEDGSWPENTLYSFGTAQSDGRDPSGNVILGLNGNLYGTTSEGGNANGGTVFAMTLP